MKNFFLQHRHFLILFLFLPLQIWFKCLEMFLVPHYITNVALDRGIPFVKEFVIPYVLWFLYLPFGLIYTGIHSKREFYKLFLFLFGGMVLSCTAFMLFPNAQSLRPGLPGSDPFSLLIKFIYATDTPTNVCPSMHVLFSIAVNAALWHMDTLKKSSKLLSLLLTVLICLSTLFIKQHSILDVICGIDAALAFYIPLYLLPSRKRGPLPSFPPAEKYSLKSGMAAKIFQLHI